MGERKKGEGKALPFNVKNGYTAMPNAVSDYYTMHPRFTGATERLYLFLLRMYNDEKGYAYPSYKAIREYTKIGSDGTVNKAIESLEYLRLIRVEKARSANGYDSNRYYFIKPIEDYNEFIRSFGDDLPSKYRDIEADLDEGDSASGDDFEGLTTWL